MTAMILTPDQARAVVGETIAPADAGDILGSLDRAIQLERQRRRLARFVPAATANAWPVGEWIAVRIITGTVRATAPAPQRTVGRVRLGEPIEVVPIMALDSWPGEIIEWSQSGALFHWVGPYGGDCTDITHPHLDLFPDAWQPGTWAYPITERSTT